MPCNHPFGACGATQGRKPKAKHVERMGAADERDVGLEVKELFLPWEATRYKHFDVQRQRATKQHCCPVLHLFRKGSGS